MLFDCLDTSVCHIHAKTAAHNTTDNPGSLEDEMKNILKQVPRHEHAKKHATCQKSRPEDDS